MPVAVFIHELLRHAIAALGELSKLREQLCTKHSVALTERNLKLGSLLCTVKAIVQLTQV